MKEKTVDHEALHRLIMDDHSQDTFVCDVTGESQNGVTASASEDETSAYSWVSDEDEEDVVAPLPEKTLKKADASASAQPRHIVLLLDASGSMRSVDVDVDAESRKDFGTQSAISRLDAAARCAVQFARNHGRLRPQDVFSVAAFHEEVQVLVERPCDASSLAALMRDSYVRGERGTFYRQGLEAASRLLHQTSGMQGEVILLSDGRPADMQSALDFFQEHFVHGKHLGVHVHGIGFGSTVESFAPLQQLACLSGGSFSLSTFSARGLNDAFSSVSSTITSLSRGVVKRRCLPKELRPADFELPELSIFGRRNVLRFSASRLAFRFDGTSFQEQSWPVTEVCRRTRPYMRGGMRLVYGFRDEDVLFKDESSWMVAKCSRYLDESLNSRSAVEVHAKSTAVARHFASLFNERLRAEVQSPTLFFVPCFLYESTGPLKNGEPRCFSAERYLPGVFLKYNSNNGYVADVQLRHHEIVQSFLHFTFQASGGHLLVSDLQGVARDKEVLLTDPQVLSLSGEFGPGDLRGGMRRCLMAHRCGPTCKKLGLKPVSTGLLKRLGQSERCRNGSESLSSWQNLGDEDRMSDWDYLSSNGGPEHFALSEVSGSRQSSASSWVHLLES